MDSTYKVPLTKILAIDPHPNADRLSLATVYGFQVVIPKDSYEVGESVIYIPIDSILPQKVESLLFGEDAKIKLEKSRVRQIRIRKFPSQGMICKPETLSSIVNPKYLKDEQDLSAILGIEKYEPPAPKEQGLPKGHKQGRKQLAHPDFHSYNGLGNIKWFPNLFQEGEQVVIQEKLHGTNARAAKLPYRANTLFKKLKKFLGLAPEYEMLYGSNKVDITNSSGYNGWYGEDIYGAVFKKMNVFDKIDDGCIVYGEIVGPGIQKGYEYGLKEHKFILFDVKQMMPDGSHYWLTPGDVQDYANEKGFEFVPVLYEGPFNAVLTKELSMGPSVFCPEEKVREGVVLKAAENYSIEGNKKALKVISEIYLDDKTNSDNH